MNGTAMIWVGAILATAAFGWWLLRSRRRARSLAMHLAEGEDVPEVGPDHREAQRWIERRGRDDDHASTGDHGGDGDGDGE